MEWKGNKPYPACIQTKILFYRYFFGQSFCRGKLVEQHYRSTMRSTIEKLLPTATALISLCVAMFFVQRRRREGTSSCNKTNSISKRPASSSRADAHCRQPRRRKVKIEVCCDTIQSVSTACACNVDRIELCAGLWDGGTTPSPGLIQAAVRIAEQQQRQNMEKRQKTLINVLIRPRGGDFVYTTNELNVMVDNIQYCKRMGVNAVVIGALTPNGKVDVPTTKHLVVSCLHMHMHVILSCLCLWWLIKKKKR